MRQRAGILLLVVGVVTGCLVGVYLYLSPTDDNLRPWPPFICFVEVEIVSTGDDQRDVETIADFVDATVALMQSNRRRIFALAPFGDNFLFHLPGPCAHAHEELPSLLDDIEARMLPAQRALLPALTILADEPTKYEVICGANATAASCPDAGTRVDRRVQQLRAFQRELGEGIEDQATPP